MSSPNNPPRTKCNKVRYDNQVVAEKNIETIKVLNDSQGKNNKNKRLHAYKCPHCPYWHIGHARK